MNPLSKQRRVLAFDFDGVICDSLEEGLLISWNAHIGAPLTAFAEPGSAGVPPQTRKRFTRCRPFTRHIGHWLVPFLIGSEPTSHAELAARYDALPRETVDNFVAAATHYRAQVRHRYPEQWLAHHLVQPKLGELLADAYIVTARDADSVAQILDAHGIGIDANRIFGSRSNKQPALKTIAISEAVGPVAVTLVDDNIENCLAAEAAGYSAWWAMWGYTSVADEAVASAHRITPVSIDDLLQPASESR